MTIAAGLRVLSSSAGKDAGTVALEIERISDHVGDFGALCHDVGYLPGGSGVHACEVIFKTRLGFDWPSFWARLLVPGGVHKLTTPARA